MSRFLRDRHYKMTIVAVHYLRMIKTQSVYECITAYLNETGISYTQEDVEIIEIAYKQKYGK